MIKTQEHLPYMRVNYLLILIASLLMASCIKESNDIATTQEPVKVGFFVGDATTRTTINDDGISTSWNKNDKIALWANASDGTAVLSAEPFGIYYRETPATLAMFTATLPSAMAADTYTYYATYPIPNSVEGTLATFTLPATQNGRITDGAAIMVASPTQGKQLGIVTGDVNGDDPYEIDDEHLSLTMNHAMHALKFFVMQDKWAFDEGETVERISFVMPQNIAGDVTLDYTNPAGTPTVANGTNIITLNLANTIGATISAARPDFAAASIIPTAAFAEGDEIEIRVLATNHASRSYISLTGREAMQAGHITPVSVDCSEVFDRHTIRFIWSGNNLGEDVHTITFYTEAGNEIYKITDVADFMKQGRHDIDFTFEDKTYLATIAGQQMVVEYESEHAIVSNYVTMPSDIATSIKCHEIPITVPYLFFEDFSATTTSTSYNDNNGTGVSNAGNTNAANLTSSYSWPSYSWTDTTNGIGIWSGARCGLEAGNSIRICTRSENAVGFPGAYYGRLDSPNMGNLKAGATVNLRIQFNYSLNRDGSKTSTHQHYLAVGTHTTAGLINAKSGVGGWLSSGLSGMTISANVVSGLSGGSGSFTNINNSVDKSVSNCTQSTRFVWEVYIDKDSSDGYYNNWAYIDNIKVQIVPTATE